jgi:hypothetical protein
VRSESLFVPHGRGAEESRAAGRAGATERPAESGATAREDSGAPSTSSGYLRDGCNRTRRSPGRGVEADRRAPGRDAREGAYLLRSNLEAETTEELWTKYIQLTEAEAVSRALKTELLIRTLFHQLEPRVKAHILVAFLGYAMWVTLKHLLHRTDADLSPAKTLAQLSTFQSADIVLPTTDGREIRLRRIATPDPNQQRLLAQLGIALPEHFNLNFECSADSVPA